MLGAPSVLIVPCKASPPGFNPASCSCDLICHQKVWCDQTSSVDPDHASLKASLWSGLLKQWRSKVKCKWRREKKKSTKKRCTMGGNRGTISFPSLLSQDASCWMTEQQNEECWWNVLLFLGLKMFLWKYKIHLETCINHKCTAQRMFMNQTHSCKSAPRWRKNAALLGHHPCEGDHTGC